MEWLKKISFGKEVKKIREIDGVPAAIASVDDENMSKLVPGMVAITVSQMLRDVDNRMYCPAVINDFTVMPPQMTNWYCPWFDAQEFLGRVELIEAFNKLKILINKREMRLLSGAEKPRTNYQRKMSIREQNERYMLLLEQLFGR